MLVICEGADEVKGEKMKEAEAGDTVKVHYTGKLDDGSVFDSSSHRDPLELTIGKKRLIPAFEQAIVGMKPGESKTVKIQHEDAFGTHDDDLVKTINRIQFPENLEPKIGQRLNGTSADGRAVTVTVTDVSESKVTVDANHPLAGEDLTFDIQLIDIT